jgi:hypothetical protein
VYCLFLVWPPGSGLDAARAERLGRDCAAVPGLARVLVHTPDRASDPFLDDGAPPALALQLYFPRIELLERAAAADGTLQRLADPVRLPLAAPEQQAMLVRAYAVPEAAAPAAEAPQCTYLVGYEGPAEDPQAWLGAYLDHHPAMMATLPGIRALEIYTRLDALSSLPFRRADHLQRNKVVFDHREALTAALHSPVREAMRAHFRALPPIAGRVTHFPMATRAWPGAGAT